MGSDEKPFYLAIARVRGIGPVRVRKLREHFLSLEYAWQADSSSLLAAGLDEKTIAALVEARKSVDPENELTMLERSGAHAITWDEPVYPRLLREIDNPPCVLWIKGTLVESDALAVAIVGTRGPTVYGRDVAVQFATQLATNSITVVSGLARGVDGTAHEAALKAGGRTIAVLGSGVDIIYPPEHNKLAAQIAASGAVISDYPLGTKPDAMNFPPRNRIISGLSLGVVVVEADERSGALITTNYAAEQGRDVFAVPGNIFAKTSRGTNRLIQQGAKLVTKLDDVLEELNLGMVASQQQAQRELPHSDNQAERAILTTLAHEPVQTDEIIQVLGLPAGDVTTALTMLELKGQIRQATGTSYVLNRRP